MGSSASVITSKLTGGKSSDKYIKTDATLNAVKALNSGLLSLMYMVFCISL